MSFTIKENPGLNKLMVLDLAGSLDMGTVDVFAEKLKKVLATGSNKLVINMKLLDSLSSAGWGCLVEWKRNYQEAGGDIALACMQEAQQRIYELMGLDAWLKSFPEVAPAVKSVTEGEK